MLTIIEDGKLCGTLRSSQQALFGKKLHKKTCYLSEMRVENPMVFEKSWKFLSVLFASHWKVGIVFST
jgi:hypothetical protein